MTKGNDCQQSSPRHFVTDVLSTRLEGGTSRLPSYGAEIDATAFPFKMSSITRDGRRRRSCSEPSCRFYSPVNMSKPFISFSKINQLRHKSDLQTFQTCRHYPRAIACSAAKGGLLSIKSSGIILAVAADRLSRPPIFVSCLPTVMFSRKICFAEL